MPRVSAGSTATQVEITQQADLGTVVDHLQVRVQDEFRHGGVGELRWLHRALRLGETC